MKKIDIIYITDDGITGHCSGVGTITQNFIMSFRDISNNFQRSFNYDLVLNVITFSEQIKDKNNFYGFAKATIERSGGKLIEIPWPQSLSENYFNFDIWKKIDKEINEIIKENWVGNKLIIANDFIFGQLDLKKGDKFIFIPHSLSVVHSQSYVNMVERKKWEKGVFEIIKNHGHAFVGYLSPYAKRILKREYSLKNSKLIPATNGYFLSKNNCTQDDYFLKKYNIPRNKEIILSISRADVYKGIEQVIRVMNDFLKENTKYHGVIIAAKFSDEPKLLQYQRSLRKKIKVSNLTFIDSFNSDLPSKLYSYHKTKVLLCLPKNDFAPLIPVEAIIFSNPGMALILTQVDCFTSIFKNKFNAFIVEQDVGKITRLIKKLLDQKHSDLVKKVNLQAKKFVLSHYDMSKNYLELIRMGVLGHTIKTEYSAGGIIIKEISSEKFILLTEHLKNTFSFPKGHIEKGERPKQTVQREVIEETGYKHFYISKQIGKIHRYSIDKHENPVKKVITMYEVSLIDEERNNNFEERCKWFQLNDAPKVLRYKQDSDFLIKHFLL